ncbi:MAG: helix-turn-helix transcriptional regulator [Planctomycetia bacterium]|nr:helix-turn-helix transcriptional regulator [Planctomycetia bacterium]
MQNGLQISASRIGQVVRERRAASNLTQRELGELAGVGLRLVSELERGKPTLRLDAVNKVLQVFGLMLGPVDSPHTDDDQK